MKRFQFQIILEFDFYKNQGSLANHMMSGHHGELKSRMKKTISYWKNLTIARKFMQCVRSGDSIADAFEH